MMTQVPDAQRLTQIAALSAAYHGVFSDGQWLGCGLTRRQLHLAVERRSIERIGIRTFRFAGHPDTPTQSAAAGLLDLGPEAYIAGDLGARLLGLDGFERAVRPAFVVPSQFRKRRTIGTVRSTQPIRPIDRIEVDGLAVLSASRLIIEESARWSTVQLGNAIDSSCRLGWTSPEFLRRQLAELRGSGKAGVRRIDVLLDDQRTESWLERTMLLLIRRSGLPAPSTQQRISSAGGPIARVDMLWKPSQLVVEVSGHRFHSTRAQVRRDQQRHTELTLLGYRVLTFTYDDVTDRPAWVIESLRRALAMPRRLADDIPRGA